MLILNRRIGESIIIGDNIQVKVIEVTDGKVKLGIEAPEEITILRHELYDAVKKENQESISSSKNVLDIIRKYKE